MIDQYIQVTLLFRANSLERDNHMIAPVNSIWKIWLIRPVLTDWPPGNLSEILDK